MKLKLAMDVTDREEVTTNGLKCAFCLLSSERQMDLLFYGLKELDLHHHPFFPITQCVSGNEMIVIDDSFIAQTTAHKRKGKAVKT